MISLFPRNRSAQGEGIGPEECYMLRSPPPQLCSHRFYGQRINRKRKELNILLRFGPVVQSRVDFHEQSPLGERLLQK